LAFGHTLAAAAVAGYSQIREG